MRIAYLSIDEVNQFTARQLAGTIGAQLDICWPRDAEEFDADAAVYDLDSLPCRERREAMSRLLSGPLPRPTLVHSYNLTDEEAALLEDHGVAVHRALGSRFLGWVATARKAWRLQTQTA